MCSPRLGPPAHSLGCTPIVPRNTAPLPALHTACRRRSAQEATPRGGQTCTVPALASSWTLATTQGGFLRVASSAADLTPFRCRFRLRSRNHRAAGAATALGPRLDGPGSPGAAATRLGAGAPSRQHRRPPALPATSGWRPQLHPPALPRKGASRPLPSAVLARKPGKHRTRLASAGVTPHQGLALRVAWRPALTRAHAAS